MASALDQRKDDMQAQSFSAEEAAATLVERILMTSARANKRILVGIAGGPGSGKSTLAAAVIGILNQLVDGAAARLPLDGFQMPPERLEALGLDELKGAPETFDATGFVALLERLKGTREPVHAPSFSKRQNRPVPDAFTLAGNVPILVVEGSYLLLDLPPWNRIGDLLDLCFFVHVPREVTKRRLMRRYQRQDGLSKEQATARLEMVDLKNHDLVARSAHRADLLLDIEDEGGGD